MMKLDDMDDSGRLFYQTEKMPRSSKRAKRSRDTRPSTANDGYDKYVMENKQFEEYYKRQLSCIEGDVEFDEFMAALRTDLPSSFRVSGSREIGNEIKDLLKNRYFPENVAKNQNDELVTDAVESKVNAPVPIPFYPDGFAWQYSASRAEIRKSPSFSKFHKFLVAETEVGNISRQEAVSMVPPLLLDVQSHHNVLDMCASPGSKSSQIVEMLHQNQKDIANIPAGMVIANDKDNKRCYTLVHQVKRLSSPCVMVTNHDATMFPFMTIRHDDGQVERLKFDRILADVPCSGDGTIRKNPSIWKMWSPNSAHGLHDIQRRILIRALQLLKVGGRVVYSTCSLNPVENESVVASILNDFPDCVKMVDSSTMLPHLKRVPGITSWNIMSKSGRWFERYDQVTADLQQSLKPTMFPCTNEAVVSQLQHCIRILPHYQNTGAFFVAVLEKTAPLSKSELNAVASETEDVAQGFKEEPYLILSPVAEEVINIQRHYGFEKSSTGHSLPFDQFLVRSENGKRRTLYFISDSVKRILESPDNVNKLKIINTGIKAFGRNSVTSFKNADDDTVTPSSQLCNLRVHGEFLQLVVPFMKEECIVDMNQKDFVQALTVEFPFLDSFGDETTVAQLQNMPFGGFIIRYDPNKHGDACDLKRPVIASVWRARTSINVLLNNKERCNVLSRIMGPDQASLTLKVPGLQRDSTEGEEGAAASDQEN